MHHKIFIRIIIFDLFQQRPSFIAEIISYYNFRLFLALRQTFPYAGMFGAVILYFNERHL